MDGTKCLEMMNQLEANRISSRLQELHGYYSNYFSYEEAAQLAERASGFRLFRCPGCLVIVSALPIGHLARLTQEPADFTWSSA